jgi:hypothetical protein
MGPGLQHYTVHGDDCRGASNQRGYGVFVADDQFATLALALAPNVPTGRLSTIAIGRGLLEMAGGV